jgi:hypothetical protein
MEDRVSLESCKSDLSDISDISTKSNIFKIPDMMLKTSCADDLLKVDRTESSIRRFSLIEITAEIHNYYDKEPTTKTISIFSKKKKPWYHFIICFKNNE